MDGVPVKISEKYKRPLRFNLPYTVNECPIRAQNVVDSANYSCTFEKNVLTKLKELRNAKETKKNERRHRLQLLQEMEQKRLDAIAAAEDEERLKQLSVSEVSYPSTDDISPLSADEKADKNCDNTAKIDRTSDHTDVPTNITYPTTSTNAESQLNILQPTLVKAYQQENNLLDDPDPLQNLKLTTKISRIAHNRNIDTLTFRDFENDTSSPFDNVELKTINDMELLAQVLQDQNESNTSFHPQSNYAPEQGYTVPNCASQPHVDGVTYLPATYLEQPMQSTNMIYGSPQHYPISNGYYIPADADTANMYMPNYQYYVPTNPYPAVEQYYSNQLPTTSGEISHVPNGSTYIPQPYYFQYPHVPVTYQPANVPEPYQMVAQVENMDQNQAATGPQTTVKSRSRSVPDIVRELNEELAKLRMSERSYNVSPAPKTQAPQVATPATSDRKEEKRNRRKSEHLPNPFDKLSPKLQDMCQKIHGMGFPLDRVARVCTLVGDNDKKVSVS